MIARRHEIILIRILDPNELKLSFKQPIVLRDLEGGREMYIDPASTARTYQERFQKHADELSALAGRLGTSLMTLSTDQPLELALRQLLQTHNERSGRARIGSNSTATKGGVT